MERFVNSKIRQVVFLLNICQRTSEARSLLNLERKQQVISAVIYELIWRTDIGKLFNEPYVRIHARLQRLYHAKMDMKQFIAASYSEAIFISP